MDDERNKRPVKKPENPVREWISDNLRYIILFGAIAIIVVICFFLFSMLASNVSQSAQNNESSITATSENAPTTEATTAPTTEASATQEPTVTEEPAATEEPAVTEEAAADEQTDNAEAGLTESTDAVSETVNRFLNALSTGNADEASAVIDGISSEDLASISEQSYAESYQNVVVYSYSGDEDGTYVAFAKYEYKYSGYDTALPALTQLYLVTAQDGSLKIASDDVQNAKVDYLNSVLENPEVKNLVDSVQQQYDAALAADPALAEYINSMN